MVELVECCGTKRKREQGAGVSDAGLGVGGWGFKQDDQDEPKGEGKMRAKLQSQHSGRVGKECSRQRKWSSGREVPGVWCEA